MTTTAKVACKDLWKIYGPSPDGVLARFGPEATVAQLKESGHIAAVADVSFDVAAGEILVVMGLSGSGKSTLIRCLARLIEPTAGSVAFDGEDITSADQKALTELRRHKMGMVFQNFGLLPHRTVADNIAFPLELQGVPRGQRLARAEELIGLVGLEGRGGYYPRELSGGQQQRVGIARSLAGEPDVWFLDEPFSALDPLIRREMQDEFLRLQSMLSKTIVFITHDFEEAVRVADRIAIMKDGRVIQLGTPEELVMRPADGYVAEFTKTAPKARLVTAGSVMKPVNGTPPLSGVPAAAKLVEVAAQVLESERPVGVLDDEGRVVGQLARRDVVDLLFERSAPTSPSARA